MAEAGTTTIAIMAKAPVAGLAKTRLIPALGPEGAATLQARLIEGAVAAATAAALGPVTLWCAPDDSHPLFQEMRTRHGVTLARQPEGDLGARMHDAVLAAGGAVLVTGTDCPALKSAHLQHAARELRGHDAVVIPVEDGGYVLIGMNRPHPGLFSDMTWSVPTVMDETRRRLRALGLSWRELPKLWDIDRPEDLERMAREGLMPPATAPGPRR